MLSEELGTRFGRRSSEYPDKRAATLPAFTSCMIHRMFPAAMEGIAELLELHPSEADTMTFTTSSRMKGA